jgi:hypothetical protein
VLLFWAWKNIRRDTWLYQNALSISSNAAFYLTSMITIINPSIEFQICGFTEAGPLIERPVESYNFRYSGKISKDEDVI